MPEIGSIDWQHQRYMVLEEARDYDQEFRVRDMATHAVKADSTYSGGTYYPVMPRLAYFGDAEDLPSLESGNYRIRVGLHPRLRHNPQVAQLIAEEIIRDQFRTLFGDSEFFRSWHILQQPELTMWEHGDDDRPWCELTEYRLRLRIDDTVMHSALTVPRRTLQEPRDSEGHMNYIKKSLSMKLMDSLAKYLQLPGFTDA